jgi:putrescine importer
LSHKNDVPTYTSAQAVARGRLAGRGGFQNVMGTPTLVLFGITYMLPLTVFTTYGIVTEMTGGRVPLAYLITLAAMLFTARSYAKMSSVFPTAGSAYVYSRNTFGGSLGFLTGWVLILDYLFLPMLCYLVIGIYMGEAFPNIPSWVFILGSLIIVTLLNLIGITTVNKANFVLVALQVVFIVVFVAMTISGLANRDVNFMAPFTGDGTVDGSGVLFNGAAVLCLSFLGFDSVSTLAEDAKEPRKTIPRAIILTTLGAGILYVILSYVAQIAYPQNDFGDPDSAALDVVGSVGGTFLSAFFIAAYVSGCVGTALTSQASVSRILFAMGRDGALPKRVFGKLNPKGTPVNAILVVAVVSLFALVIGLLLLSEMINFGALAAFTMVNLSVIKYSFFDQKNRTPAGVIGGLIVPAIGTILVLWLWTSLSSLSLTVGGIWLACGVVILGIITRGFRKPVPKMQMSD